MNIFKLENLLLIAAALLGLNNAVHSAERPYWVSGIVGDAYKFHFNNEGAALLEKMGQKPNVDILIDGKKIDGIKFTYGVIPPTKMVKLDQYQALASKSL
ncbi:MAG: hypothetical protein KA715_05110 [Xanthomonadaceae bacterium]|nr:hypothetical protein [Xanthomonadaceae bacterium]